MANYASVLEDVACAGPCSQRLGIPPVFSGEETGDALLSNSSRMTESLRDPLLPLETLLDWVAEWIRSGKRLLGKPTGFERRDGRF